MDQDHPARRAKILNDSGYTRREYDEFDMHDWADRDIAMYAVRELSRAMDKLDDHVRICNKQAAILLRLLWGVLAGVGFIVVNLVVNYASHLLQKVS